jgi:hypothetical protein
MCEGADAVLCSGWRGIPELSEVTGVFDGFALRDAHFRQLLAIYCLCGNTAHAEQTSLSGTSLWEWLSLGYDHPENTSAQQRFPDESKVHLHFHRVST